MKTPRKDANKHGRAPRRRSHAVWRAGGAADGVSIRIAIGGG